MARAGMGYHRSKAGDRDHRERGADRGLRVEIFMHQQRHREQRAAAAEHAERKPNQKRGRQQKHASALPHFNLAAAGLIRGHGAVYLFRIGQF